MGKKLFEDEDGEGEDELSKIEINEEFKRRYEHNKRREDLQRYEELKKKGVITSDSEEDEEEDDDTDHKKFFEKLLQVRNRDPSIFNNKNAKLFDSDTGDHDDDDDDRDNDKDVKQGKEEKKKKRKAAYLKDVVAQHLMEEGPEFEDVTDQDNKIKKKKVIKTYVEEQDELRRAFLNAARAEEGDLFTEKDNKGPRDSDDNDSEFEKTLGEYFGKEGDLDENQKFLKEFFVNKMWVDKDRHKDVDVEEVEEVIRDEHEVERQDKYDEERCYRHEENAGDRVLGHSRKVEDSVRKKKNRRKEQRERKEERIKVAEMERKEELKHLKNLKKEEMMERMKKIMEVAGIKDDCPLDLDDLEEEFVPEEYDKMMKKAFDEKYYDTEDVDPQFGSDYDDDGGDIKKPDFDKEDELLGLPKNWDVLGSGGGFSATRESILKMKAENGNSNQLDEIEEEEEEEADDEEAEAGSDRGNVEESGQESKRKRKRKMSLVKKAREEMLEEYYKLDYEDTIGDLKTRFRYGKVDPNRYGLKATDILLLDDKELNQFVSLKKLAPYREKEWKVPNSKRQQYKMRIKEVWGKWNEQDAGKKKNKKNNKKSKGGGDKQAMALPASQDGKAELGESNANMVNPSRQAKRRHRRQAELKISHSRRMAYVQAQPKAKNEGKQRNA